VARAQLVAAGIELVAERTLGDLFGHLRVNDLARTAGLTSGAFYHYWDGQDAYRADVLDALLAGDRADARPELFAPSGEVDPDPVACVRQSVDRAAATLVDDPAHRLELALWVHDEPTARRHLRRRARAADAAFATALGDLLDRSGRRADPLGGLGSLATLAVALSDGLRTQALIDSGVLSPSTPDAWSPPALLALLLLVGGTIDGTPAPVPDPPRPAKVSADGPVKRRRLVDLGVAAALEDPTGNALDHIRADDVVARLDLTVGAFYHYWSSQDDYRDDVLEALLAADRYVDTTSIADQVGGFESADTLDEAIRATTSWYWSLTAGHPENRVLFGLVTIGDPYLAPHLVATTIAQRTPWEMVLDALLERFDLRLRPPLDTGLVVVGLSALLDGLIVRHGLDPKGLGRGEDGWTAWGRATRALLTAATAPAGDDRDLFTAARTSLGAPT
jgi:AcrR family transcriptional regulator